MWGENWGRGVGDKRQELRAECTGPQRLRGGGGGGGGLGGFTSLSWFCGRKVIKYSAKTA